MCYVYGKWSHMTKNCWKKQGEGSGNAIGVSKRKQRTVSSWLAFSNLYNVLCLEKLGNKLNFSNNTKRVRDMQCILWPLQEVWMKVGLEKLENYEEIAVKALLDSEATDLFMDTAIAKEKCQCLKSNDWN